MIATEISQKVKLITGEFTPSEAMTAINALFQEKINFHKVQTLQNWMRDIHCDNCAVDAKIESLTQELENAKEFIRLAKQSGANLEIVGNIQLKMLD